MDIKEFEKLANDAHYSTAKIALGIVKPQK